MGITAKELLKIAAAEIGYKEKATNTQLDHPTANAGSKNWTKYARDLYAAGYYNGNKNGYEWCDVFVDHCFFVLCGGDAAKAQAVQCQTGPLGAGCRFSAQYYKAQGRYYTTNPQPGDQIFFGDFDHTGLVESVTADTITTIEGNASNQVMRRTYKRTDPIVTGFGRPKFEEGASNADAPQPGTPGETAAPLAQTCTVTLPVLRRGSSGGYVKTLQHLLNAYIGTNLRADGVFGAMTEGAVWAYQKARGLGVDGVVGAITWGKLLM